MTDKNNENETQDTSNSNMNDLNLDIDFSQLDTIDAEFLINVDTSTDKVDLTTSAFGVSDDPCSGKTGVILSACRLKEQAKAWERSHGIFFSEDRAEEAGGGLIIKGSGFKYNKRF